jgi:CDP-diacylglycerol--serine O-phosphatidyltransferase
MIKKQIPNIVTSLNLLCGFLGILTIAYGYNSLSGLPNNDIPIYLMFAAAFFDFVDGFVARLLKVDSPLGKQLDSLADVVTFGVLPGLLMFVAIGESLACYQNNYFFTFFDIITNGGAVSDVYIGRDGFVGSSKVDSDFLKSIPYLLPALLVPILSAFRLAKFNIDTRQSHSFIGLPTPANGLFLATVYYVIQHNSYGVANCFHPALLAGLVFVFAVLLVAPIPLFAMKFKAFTWKGNEVRFIFLAMAITLLAIFQLAAFPIVIILYIITSIINNILTRNNNEV